MKFVKVFTTEFAEKNMSTHREINIVKSNKMLCELIISKLCVLCGFNSFARGSYA